MTIAIVYSKDINPVGGHYKNYHLLLARALLGTTAMSLSYFGAHLITLHETATIYFVYPAIAAVSAWILLGE